MPLPPPSVSLLLLVLARYVLGECSSIVSTAAPFIWSRDATKPLEDMPWPVPLSHVSAALRGSFARRYADFVFDEPAYVRRRFWKQYATPPVKRFAKRLVTSDGFIVDRANCTAERNGGCVARAAKWHESPTSEPRRRALVVTLAAEWAAATWHFPMEALLALAFVNATTLAAATIHMSGQTAYMRQWCELVGVEWNRTATGTLAADELVVPRMGGCGAPMPAQLDWLKAHVWRAVSHPSSARDIVLIKRTASSRPVHNVGAVEQAVHRFARIDNRTLVLHDDAHLPSLRVQLQRFANAAIIVAPHGAGELLMIASHTGACVVEMMDTGNINACFMHLAYNLGHHYYGAVMRGGVAALDDLERGLEFCRARYTPPPTAPK